MRYAQIVIGLKGSGKSTYVKLMAKYGESRGRKVHTVNLDPRVSLLEYESPFGDIRDVISSEEYTSFEGSEPGTGAGFQYILNYIMSHKWLLELIGGDGEDGRDGEHFIFDCPGELENNVHLKIFKEWIRSYFPKNFRVCVVYIRDATISTNGYNFVSACLTPLTSFVNLSVPHLLLFMKFDSLSDENKQKILLFINSELRDVLRFEHSRSRSGDPELAALASTATSVLELMSYARKKYYPLDIANEDSFKNLLLLLDEMLAIPQDL